MSKITDTITRIGPHAVAPILDFVEDAPNDAESVLPLRVLGDIVAAYGQQCSRSDIDRAAEFCLRCWADDSIRFGAFIYALSHICAAGMAPAELTSRLAGECRERLWQAPYTFDLLEALATGCDLGRLKRLLFAKTDAEIRYALQARFRWESDPPFPERIGRKEKQPRVAVDMGPWPGFEHGEPTVFE